MPDTIKIFGERNTGTNALRLMVARQSASRVLPSNAYELNPPAGEEARRLLRTDPAAAEVIFDRVFAGRGCATAWKHCATNFPNAAPLRGSGVIFVLRHPASWVLSLHRNPYHAVGTVPADLGEFLRFPWKTAVREHMNGAVVTPLELMNRKLASYRRFAATLDAAGIPWRMVRFEDLVLRQAEVFDTIRPLLTDPAASFREMAEPAKPGSLPLEALKALYGGESWREEAAPHAEAINAAVAWDRFEPLGYAPL